MELRKTCHSENSQNTAAGTLISPTKIVKLTLNRAEAAAVLGISKSTLDKLDIPTIKAGRRVLYRIVSIEAWLRKREAGASTGSGDLGGMQNNES
jgi:hypothetical protein